MLNIMQVFLSTLAAFAEKICDNVTMLKIVYVNESLPLFRLFLFSINPILLINF